jgi:quinol monooxygenase YgiN
MGCKEIRTPNQIVRTRMAHVGETDKLETVGGANQMSEPRVIVAGWCTVDPKKRDEAVESFKALVLRGRRAPGCLDLSITADLVDASRVNIFELWQSEEDLKEWRAVAKHPKRITPLLRMEVQKHVIDRSGPPFASSKRRRSPIKANVRPSDLKTSPTRSARQ